MFQAVDVYLEKRKTRQYAGRLFKQGNRFVFEYDESYRICSNPIPLGPDLPLDRKTHTSLKLFPSFKDRIPSRENPAYREYCRTAGIPFSEKDPFVLLLKLAKKGPSSFIFLPALKEEDFDGGDMRRLRQNLQLSVRDFASLFDISPATIYRVENGKTDGQRILRQVAGYAKDPRTALSKIRQTGSKINETKRRFAEVFFQSQLPKTHTSPWEVTGADVEKCNSQQAVELLRKLVLSECGSYGIPQSRVHISHNLTTPDGGQDGLVFWPAGAGPLSGTNFFPRSYNCFQVKAGKVSPSQCQKEILDSKGNIKPAIQDVIKNRGAYVLFSTKGVAGTGLREREKALAESLQAGGTAPVADRGDGAGFAATSRKVKFYDANIIADWINTFPPVSVWFLKEVCKRSLGPWLSWEEWRREDPDYRSEFMFHENLNDKKNAVCNFLSKPKQVVHLRGAGGVGKTRLALEVFRLASSIADYRNQKIAGSYLPDTATGSRTEKKPERPLEDLSPFVLYSSAEVLQPSDLRKLKTRRAVLVIDDCSKEKMESFHKIAIQEDSRLSLLTIGSDSPPPEKRSERSFQQTGGSVGSLSDGGKKLTVTLEPDREIVKKILSKNQNIANKYFHPEAMTLTQGFPLMAKLLKEAGPRILEKDDTATIRKKMLWGLEQPDPEAAKALKACALFDTICVDSPEFIISSGIQRGKAEAEYVAQKIAKMGYDTFYGKIQFFKKRRIIQQHGRFIQVRPKPLAVWLAGELIEETPPESLIRWFSDQKLEADRLILHGLRESFCKQIAWLTNSESAQILAKKLCEKGGLFGTAEALDTEWGSRCFRHLSEVDPETALRTLWDVFSDKTAGELVEIREGRRDLIEALQQLAVRENLYPKAARLLLKFAEAENENWSNNATGVFMDHFQLYLSGTEAGPDKRFQIISEIRESQSVEQKKIALHALDKALSAGPFSRPSDIMQTTVGKTFKDWIPKTYGEQWSYFQKALDLSVQFATEDESAEIQERACKFIAVKLGFLLRQGFYDDVERAVNTVWLENSQEGLSGTKTPQTSRFMKNNKNPQSTVSKTGKIITNKQKVHRFLVIDRLSRFLQYNSKKITKDKRKRVEKMLDLLQSEQSLEDRIRSYVAECSWSVLYDQRQEKENERYEQRFKELIKDFVNLIEGGKGRSSHKEPSNLKPHKIGQSDFDKNRNSGDEKNPENSSKVNINQESLVSKGQKSRFSKDARAALEPLFHREQRNTVRFAEELAFSLKDPFTFADELLNLAKEWKQNKGFNFTFPAGILEKLYRFPLNFQDSSEGRKPEKSDKRSINCIDPEKTKQLLDKIAGDDSLRDFLIPSYRYMDLRDQDIIRLINVMDKMTPQALNELKDLTTGKRCKLVSADVIEKLMKALIQKKELRFSWDALQIYTYYESKQKPNEKKTKLLPVLYNLLTRDDLLSKKERYSEVMNDYNDHYYREAVGDILSSEMYGKGFSIHFINQIMASDNFFDIGVSFKIIRECLMEVIQKHPDPILSEITKVLIANQNLKDRGKKNRYDKIKQMFRAENFSGDSFFNDRKTNPLSVLTDEQLKKWCQKAPDHIPAFLAKSLPLLSADQKSWTPFAQFLFDEYGDRKSVIQAVSANLLNTFLIIGKISRYYKKLISVLKQIEDHKRENVRNFVDREISFLEQQINREKKTETERMEFGIY